MWMRFHAPQGNRWRGPTPRLRPNKIFQETDEDGSTEMARKNASGPKNIERRRVSQALEAQAADSVQAQFLAPSAKV